MSSQLIICLVICALTIFSYLWGKLSLATTSVLAAVVFYITGCIDDSVITSSVGNVNGIVMLSMFVVAAGFNKTQLVRNISAGIVKIAKGSFTKIMVGYILCAALLCSLISSNLIPFCILYPLLAGTVEDMGISPSKVMFPLGLTCICCLGIIPIGSGAASFAQNNSYLVANGATGYEMQVLDTFIGRFPVLIACVLYSIFLAPRLAPDKPPVPIKTMENAAAIAERAENKPKMSPFHERCGYLIFFGVSIGLLFSNQLGVPPWLITLCGALLVVITGVMTGKEAVASMPISIWLLFVGSLCLASALNLTGAGLMIGELIARVATRLHSSVLIYAVFFLVPFIMTQVMFNQTVGTIVTPIAIQASMALGVNPIGPIICVSAASLTAFMSPMATGTVPYFMAAGGYDMRSVFKQSVLPAVIFSIVQIVWLSIAFPLY